MYTVSSFHKELFPHETTTAAKISQFIVTEVIVNENNRAKPRTSKLYLQILNNVYTIKRNKEKCFIFKF